MTGQQADGQYQGVGQQGNQGAKQYKYRKPAKAEQSDSDESTESTDGSEIGFISTKCALRRPLTYDNQFLLYSAPEGTI